MAGSTAALALLVAAAACGSQPPAATPRPTTVAAGAPATAQPTPTTEHPWLTGPPTQTPPSEQDQLEPDQPAPDQPEQGRPAQLPLPQPAPAPKTELQYAVGLRVLTLDRGPGRPLPTTIFYPAAGPRGDALAGYPVNGAWNVKPAAGRFPLVLFSHGLHGTPQIYASAIASWAAAGFIVAAPSYPFTSKTTAHYRRSDIVNQPADAIFVIGAVRRLDHQAGDPLRGHIDTRQVAAVGHSAGGFTTTGLFRAGHPRWLRSGVVIAGWRAPGAFAGPPATMLFVQGAYDSVVPVPLGRAAYDAVPWDKSYLLLPGAWHADYMVPTGRTYALMEQTVTDFLRWTLDGDQAARRRLPPSSFPASAAN